MAPLTSLPEGYRAVVIGGTGGIGAAVAGSLRNDPRCAAIVTLSRADGLDLVDEAGIRAAAERIAEGGEIDLVFDATGALTIDGYGPEKSLRAISAEGMRMQFAVNAVGPAMLLKHFAPLLPRGRRSLFATLSARVGSIGDNRLGGWISYRAAKAALNQIVRTAAIEIGRSRPEAVVVALHPGTVATRLSDPFASNRDRFSPAESAERLLRVLDALPSSASGGFFAHDGSPIDW
ncbi:MAG: SDR family oxidoreductase [Methylobacterium mesophilicum]|nr:SDR family oxidoreductase [Methylobacterium mesophilicum]